MKKILAIFVLASSIIWAIDLILYILGMRQPTQLDIIIAFAYTAAGLFMFSKEMFYDLP